MTELNTFNSLETTVFLVFAGFLIGLCVGSMIRDYEHADMLRRIEDFPVRQGG